MVPSDGPTKPTAVTPQASIASHPGEPERDAAPPLGRSASARWSRLVGGFALRLLFWYGLLMALITLWPAYHQTYAAAFRSCAGSVFASFHGSGRTEWLPVSGHGHFETEVRMRNIRSPGRRGEAYCDTRQMGYAPLSLMMALVLATPLPWRRRGIAMLWGLLAVHLFIALRLELMLLSDFCTIRPIRLYNLSPFWQDVLDKTYWALAGSLPSAFVAPAILWVLVTFRRGDWERWLVRRQQGSNAPGRQ